MFKVVSLKVCIYFQKLHTSVYIHFTCAEKLNVCLFNFIFFKNQRMYHLKSSMSVSERKKNNAFFFFFNSWSCTFYTKYWTVYIQMYSYKSSYVWCEMHARSYLIICSRGKYIPNCPSIQFFFFFLLLLIYGDICDALF